MTTIERAVATSSIPAGAALTEEQTNSLLAKRYRILFQGFDGLMLKDRVETFKTWG